MTAKGIPANAKQLAALVKEGEGHALEFKRSTGELKEGIQSLCAFLNGSGGMVLFGVRPEGIIEGLKAGRELVLAAVEGGVDMRPFTYEGRPYERVGSTTRRMPQAKYERLLVERGHAKRRWENLSAEGLALKDLDRKEILRTRELAIQQSRISSDTRRDIGEILDRLGLRVSSVLTRAAQVLYGTRFMPDYPQCLLKLGRFRGTTVTGEIVDNRQEHMNAFSMVREGMAFLERTMPLGARFPKGTVFREDRFPVPPAALREILLNAVMHRDYSHYSGYVAIAIFDDRIEIQSYGRLPGGVTVEQLSGPHLSKPTNPSIAEAFHRTGAVEVWGRGTNRVIEMCEKHGAAPPVFEERQGFLVVTFRAPLVAGGAAAGASRAESGAESRAESGAESLLRHLADSPLAISDWARRCGCNAVTGAFKRSVRRFLEQGLIERTIPDKPNSRLQKYRLTPAGEKALKERGEEDMK